MNGKIKEFFDARKRHGLSLRQLAKLLGVSHEAVASYERGKYPPRKEVWIRVQEVLGMEGAVEDFWGRKSGTLSNARYDSDDRCKIDGCTKRPVAKGLCRVHYNKERYVAIKQKSDAAKEEARRKLRM